MDYSCSGLQKSPIRCLTTRQQCVHSLLRITLSRDVRVKAEPAKRSFKPPNRDQKSAPRPRPSAGSRPSPPPLPRFPNLIVVEGFNDMKAVRKAVQADVFVLGTATHAGYDRILGQLKEAASKYNGVVVLTDPDVAGRQARNLLDTKLEGCWHAFVPVQAATAKAAVRTKEEGNVGIEHAGPQAIIQALKNAKQSKPQRAEFSRERLQELGLINPMHEMGGDVTRRRNLVCDFLGLGACDGKQLLRQLNRYDFSEERVLEAKAWADDKLRSRIESFKQN